MITSPWSTSMLMEDDSNLRAYTKSISEALLKSFCQGFYRGSVGFRRLSVGLLPSVRHLRLRPKTRPFSPPNSSLVALAALVAHVPIVCCVWCPSLSKLSAYREISRVLVAGGCGQKIGRFCSKKPAYHGRFCSWLKKINLFIETSI